MIAEPADSVEVRKALPLFHVTDPRLRTFQGSTAYECRVVLIPEDGGYSAHALRLPGVVSQGGTEEESLHNIAEAFGAAVRCYLDSGESIPWANDVVERPKGSKERWIIVDVK